MVEWSALVWEEGQRKEHLQTLDKHTFVQPGYPIAEPGTIVGISAFLLVCSFLSPSLSLSLSHHSGKPTLKLHFRCCLWS